MRHRLIHGYDLLDLDILWQTVEEDLPKLVEQLQELPSSSGFRCVNTRPWAEG